MPMAMQTQPRTYTWQECRGKMQQISHATNTGTGIPGRLVGFTTLERKKASSGKSTKGKWCIQIITTASCSFTVVRAPPCPSTKKLLTDNMTLDSWMNSKVLAQTAPAPEGPWSDPVTVFQATPITNGSSIYSPAPHTYYDPSGKTLVVTYTNDPNCIQAINVVCTRQQDRIPIH